MYRYQPIDQRFVDERVAQFRDQVRRRLADALTEDEFRPLRLQNGLYLQKHAYMLRVAIPYGTLSAAQLRMLAHIARTYDRSYGHFTTRQNIQYNWLALEQVPDLLADLASVEMHAIQTSGNCVRNVTADHLAGIASDELFDPRPYCELMRQYSTVHPEFLFLPRKFKIAFTGATTDRAAVVTHDLAFRAVLGPEGQHGFAVIVGGGLGRTPIIGPVVRPFLEPDQILAYTEAVLRVYNLLGNRENMHKARIKILVRQLGVEAFTALLEAEYARIRARGHLRLDPQRIDQVAACFALPALDPDPSTAHREHAAADPRFRIWLERNVEPHKVAGHHIVHIPLKSPGRAPGDVTDAEMDGIAALADAYAHGEVRTTHVQNLLLPHVRSADLFAVWQGLAALDLAWPVRNTLVDMITCPGADFCNLANAVSIPVAKAIYERFADLDELHEIGELQLKMSGCVNSCAHHHVGHIGILGIDKRGEDFYQIMLGGSAGDDAELGNWIGRAIARDEVVDAVEDIIRVFLERRQSSERFIDTVRRIGVGPFSARVYRDDAVRPQRASA